MVRAEMIINHEKRIIFIKTKKTAGTSFEIALSKFCGKDCIITPITPSDENLRKQMGFRGAQNYQNYFWPEEGAKTNGTFFNHIPASLIKSVIPERVWHEYTKVTIVRNPFDSAISRYFWEGGENTGLTYSDYLKTYPQHLLENSKIAPLSGDAKCDVYLQYEKIEEDLKRTGLMFLWKTFNSIRVKADKRPKQGASVQEIYKKYPESLDVVRELCGDELKHFNYEAPVTS